MIWKSCEKRGRSRCAATCVNSDSTELRFSFKRSQISQHAEIGTGHRGTRSRSAIYQRRRGAPMPLATSWRSAVSIMIQIGTWLIAEIMSSNEIREGARP
jgi:hypothetical protein